MKLNIIKVMVFTLKNGNIWQNLSNTQFKILYDNNRYEIHNNDKCEVYSYNLNDEYIISEDSLFFNDKIRMEICFRFW